MKTSILIILLIPLIIKAQFYSGNTEPGSPQPYVVPPKPDSIIAVYDSIKTFAYWTNPPLPLVIQKDYVYNEKNKMVSYTTYDLFDELGYLLDPIRHNFEYNDQGLLSAYNGLTYSYDEAGYLVFIGNGTKYEWDENHNLLSIIESQGSDTSKAEFWSYDSHGNISTYLMKGIWSNETEFRELLLKHYTYNDQNNHIETVIMDKYGSETWDTSHRITYKYNQQNLLEETMKEDFKSPGISVNTFIRYDSNSNPDSIISYWMLPGYWTYYGLEVQDYDEKNRLVYNMHHYPEDDSIWIQQIWSTWTYDDNNNLIDERVRYRQPPADWYVLYRISSMFDENNLLVSKLDSREEADSVHYYFKSKAILGLPDHSPIYNLIVYPNPSASHVTFETDGIRKGFISITDMNGRTINQIPITGKTTVWNPGIITSGIYIYKIESEGRVGLGKIVIH